MSIKVAITDSEIIEQLPDTSVIHLLMNENLTADDVKNILGQKITRKKLQYLFEYNLTDNLKNKLISILMTEFANNLKEQDSETPVKIDKDNKIIIQGETVYDFSILTIGDSVFQINKFNELFFTEDMIKFTFDLNDDAFLMALMSIKKFWDKLLSNDNLYSSFKTNYGNYWTRAYQNIEPAFVKIVIKEAGLDVFENYRNINELIADTVIIDIIKDSDAKNVFNHSYFGGIVDILSTTGRTYNYSKDLKSNLYDIAKLIHDNNLYDKALNPFLLEKMFENENIVKNYYGIFTKTLSNDVYVGKLIARHSGRDENVTFTQELNSKDYSPYVVSVAFSNDSNVILDRNILLNNPTVYSDYKNLIEANTKLKTDKPFCVNNSDDSKVNVYVAQNNQIVYLPVVFPDATSSKFNVSKKITKPADSVLMPFYSAIENDAAFISGSLRAIAQKTENQTPITFLSNNKVYYIESTGNHIFAIDVEGNLLSNKYISDEKVELDNLNQISISPNLFIVRTADAIYMEGNLTDKNVELIRNQANNSIQDIDKIFALNNSVVAVLNSGALKEVLDAGLVDWHGLDAYETKDEDGNVTSSAAQNGVVDIIDRLGTLFVLDKSNNLWYKDMDNSIVKLVDIASIESAGNGILVTPKEGEKYLLVLFNNKIRKYEYNYNL